MDNVEKIMQPHIVTPDNAAKFNEWIRTRGGIAVWGSINLSNPGASWSTPANNLDGTPTLKPSWECGNRPERVITSPDDIVVSMDKECRRFHVALRMGSQGLSIKVSDGGSRKIRAAVAKAGEGAYHVFDGQDAVIMKPESQVPLLDFLKG